MQKINAKDFESRVLELVNNASEAITIDFVSRELGISWDTGRALCLGLAVRGKIVALKTMKSWIFMPTKLQEETSGK
jgi:hypothetical protein